MKNKFNFNDQIISEKDEFNDNLDKTEKTNVKSIEYNKSTELTNEVEFNVPSNKLKTSFSIKNISENEISEACFLLLATIS